MPVADPIFASQRCKNLNCSCSKPGCPCEMASKYERFFWKPKDRVWQYTTDRFPCVTYFGGPQAYLVTPDEVNTGSRPHPLSTYVVHECDCWLHCVYPPACATHSLAKKTSPRTQAGVIADGPSLGLYCGRLVGPNDMELSRFGAHKNRNHYLARKPQLCYDTGGVALTSF